jgi:hypothetical protein
MAEERLEETDEGYYVQVGDVREWRWKDASEAVKEEAPKPVSKPKAAPRATSSKALDG